MGNPGTIAGAFFMLLLEGLTLLIPRPRLRSFEADHA
jgi:hypothetical protein